MVTRTPADSSDAHIAPDGARRRASAVLAAWLRIGALCLIVGCGDGTPSSVGDARELVDTPAEADSFEVSDASDVAAPPDIPVRSDVEVGTDGGNDGVEPAPTIEFVRVRDGDFVWGTQVLSVESNVPMTRVRFFLDDELLREDDASPFAATFDCDDLSAGLHEVRAEGLTSDGETLTVAAQVEIDRARPDVAIIEPGTIFDGPVNGLLRVEVEASDNHEIAFVQLMVDFELVGRFEAGILADDIPLSLPTGQYALSAVAVDRTGLRRTASTEIFVCPDRDQFPCLGACLEQEDLETSIGDCGACGNVCAVGERCEAGSCFCPEPRVECDSVCADTDRDVLNCGGCGAACSAGEGCVAGECVPGVPEGFVLIGPGEFEMGAEDFEWGAEPQEFPRHAVTLTRPYLLAENELTHGEWTQFFPANPSASWDCGPSCPVESVTWFEAVEYLNARSVSEGLRPCYLLGGCNEVPVGQGRRCISVFVDAPGQDPVGCEGYRLPTEAEWEFAARGGSVGSTYTGPTTSYECHANPGLLSSAWFSCNAGGSPQPVGQLLPNPYGLYDVLGNVFEWTGDLWGEYPAEPQVDPTGPPSEIVIRPIRGGGFNERSARNRTTSRLSQDPAVGLTFVGFRVARTFQP